MSGPTSKRFSFGIRYKNESFRTRIHQTLPKGFCGAIVPLLYDCVSMSRIYPRNVPKSVVPCIRLLFCPGMLLIHFDLIIKYYVIAGKTAFKLKLRPESTKVVAASVNLVVEKTESGLATNSIFFCFLFVKTH